MAARAARDIPQLPSERLPIVTANEIESLRSITVFDEVIYVEATSLYAALTPVTYAQHGTTLLNPPSPKERIEVSAGLRALTNSELVLGLSSDGTLPVSLFYLVTLCEGLLMPHLQPLIDLSVQRGHLGPRTASGRHQELDDAREKLGPAIRFLASHAQPALVPDAPAIARRLVEYEAVRLSKIRNAIAHFKFRLEPVRVALADTPEYPKSEQPRAIAGLVLDTICSLVGIHNAHRGHVIDFDKSVLRYEENLNRPLTARSSSKTFKEVRDLLSELERFAHSLMMAYVAAGSRFGSGLIIGQCTSCVEGHVVAPAGVHRLPCPACGVEGDLSVTPPPT